MNYILKCCAIICTFLLFTAELSAQNKNTSDIGLIPFYKFTGENLLIIDASEGKVVSVATVGETIYDVVINEDESTFYLLTANNLYKGEVESGEIIDQYKFNDLDMGLLENKTKVWPYGITHDGRAIYHKIGASNAENNYAFVQELYVADIDSKTSSFWYDISPQNLSFGSYGKTTGECVIIDKPNLLMKYLDSNGREKANVHIPNLPKKHNFLNNYKVTHIKYNPNRVGYENLVTITYDKEDDSSDLIYVVFDMNKNEVVYHEKYSSIYRWNFPTVAGINTNDSTYYFAEVVQTGESGPLNPDNYKAVIYRNPELENAIIEIPKTRFVSIHNDIYALVRREYELELINLETKERVWRVDTDF